VRRFVSRFHLLALALELCFGAEAGVRVPARNQFVGDFAVGLHPLRLAIGTVRSAHIGTLVPVEPEPAQIFQERDFALTCAALDVGVFDAQDERAAVMTREQVIENRRARTAHVEISGGAGRETNANTFDLFGHRN